MFDRDDLYDDFEEDRLPPGQKTIMTQNIIKFRMFARKVIEAKEQTGYGLMGIVTAKSGWGKSIAILDFLENVPRRPHTGLPTCIGIRVKPQANPRLSFPIGFTILPMKPIARWDRSYGHTQDPLFASYECYSSGPASFLWKLQKPLTRQR